MTQAIFYAMVLNDAVKLGVTSDVATGTVASILKSLSWDIFESWLERNKEALRRAQLPRLTDLGDVPEQADDQEEDSGSSDAPPASSDEE